MPPPLLPQVKAFVFFIAEADAAEAYKEAMPAGRAHVVMETSEVRVHSNIAMDSIQWKYSVERTGETQWNMTYASYLNLTPDT